MIDEYDFKILTSFVFTFPIHFFSIIILIPIFCPFYGLYLLFDYSITEVITSFIDEILNNLLYKYMKFWIATFMMIAGLIQHKTYIRYVYEQLEYEEVCDVYFGEYYKELPK